MTGRLLERRKEKKEYTVEIDLFGRATKVELKMDDIRIGQKNFPVFQICRWISNGDLVLNPDFQRNFVWDRKKTVFIDRIVNAAGSDSSFLF